MLSRANNDNKAGQVPDLAPWQKTKGMLVARAKLETKPAIGPARFFIKWPAKKTAAKEKKAEKNLKAKTLYPNK